MPQDLALFFLILLSTVLLAYSIYRYSQWRTDAFMRRHAARQDAIRQHAQKEISELKLMSLLEAMEMDDYPVSLAVLPPVLDNCRSEYQLAAEEAAHQLAVELAHRRGLKVSTPDEVRLETPTGTPRISMGALMGVRYILDSTITLDQTSVKVEVYLREAASGYQHWGETYDRASEDLLNLLTEISLEVANVLREKSDFPAAAQIDEEEKQAEHAALQAMKPVPFRSLLQTLNHYRQWRIEPQCDLDLAVIESLSTTSPVGEVFYLEVLLSRKQPITTLNLSSDWAFRSGLRSQLMALGLQAEAADEAEVAKYVAEAVQLAPGLSSIRKMVVQVVGTEEEVAEK